MMANNIHQVLSVAQNATVDSTNNDSLSSAALGKKGASRNTDTTVAKTKAGQIRKAKKNSYPARFKNGVQISGKVTGLLGSAVLPKNCFVIGKKDGRPRICIVATPNVFEIKAFMKITGAILVDRKGNEVVAAAQSAPVRPSVVDTPIVQPPVAERNRTETHQARLRKQNLEILDAEIKKFYEKYNRPRGPFLRIMDEKTVKEAAPPVCRVLELSPLMSEESPKSTTQAPQQAVELLHINPSVEPHKFCDTGCQVSIQKPRNPVKQQNQTATEQSSKQTPEQKFGLNAVNSKDQGSRITTAGYGQSNKDKDIDEMSDIRLEGTEKVVFVHVPAQPFSPNAFNNTEGCLPTGTQASRSTQRAWNPVVAAFMPQTNSSVTSTHSCDAMEGIENTSSAITEDWLRERQRSAFRHENSGIQPQNTSVSTTGFTAAAKDEMYDGDLSSSDEPLSNIKHRCDWRSTVQCKWEMQKGKCRRQGKGCAYKHLYHINGLNDLNDSMDIDEDTDQQTNRNDSPLANTSLTGPRARWTQNAQFGGLFQPPSSYETPFTPTQQNQFARFNGLWQPSPCHSNSFPQNPSSFHFPAANNTKLESALDQIILTGQVEKTQQREAEGRNRGSHRTGSGYRGYSHARFTLV